MNLIACIASAVSCMLHLTSRCGCEIVLFLVIVFMLIACTVCMGTTGCEFLSWVLHTNAVTLSYVHVGCDASVL